MMTRMDPIRVIYFSDVLCVWAYVSQVRVDELREKLGDQVSVDVRFCPVFGDAHTKLTQKWKDRGGLSGYGAHVRDVGEQFDNEIHPNAWRKLAPRSSLACHLFLCAVRALEARGELQAAEGSAFEKACRRLRTMFFRDLKDISTREVQFAVAEELSLPSAAIEACLSSGEAHAELSGDYEMAREHVVTVSPTMILNEGRQRLNGNVSFNVIEANVRELIAHQSLQSSDC